MSDSQKNIAHEVVDFLKDVGSEVFARHDNKVANEALTSEKKREIKTAATMLCEAEVETDKIIDLLQKYYEISAYEARTYWHKCQVSLALKKLVNYMYNEGYKYPVVREFVLRNNVEQKLENDPTLWKLSPEKLKAALEKK